MDEEKENKDANKPIILDEISMDDFLSQIRDSFRLFIRLVALLAAFLRRNLGILLLCLVLGVGGTWLYFNLAKPKYEVSITLSYNKLAKKIYGDALVKLQRLIADKNAQSLARQLNISAENALDIISIDSRNMRNDPLISHMDQDKEPFSVITTTKSRVLADSVSYRILSYLENIPYIKESMGIELKRLEEEEKHLASELALLDSLRILYNQNLKQNLNKSNDDLPFLLRESINPISFYDKYNERFKRWQDVKSALESYRAFKIIDQPIVNLQRPPLGIIEGLLKGSAAGLLLFTIISLFKEARRLM